MTRRSNLAFGAALVFFVFLLALVGSFQTPYGPVAVTGSFRETSSFAYWLGTDNGGFNIASRLIAGVRLVLLAGLGSAVGAVLVGIPTGMVTGMSRGWGVSLIVRGADMLHDFPTLLLATFFTTASGGLAWAVLVAISLSVIPAFARIVRAATIQVMGLAFIEAAWLSGTSCRQIAPRYVPPNTTSVSEVRASANIGIATLTESGLSYLGLGLGTEAPIWGRTLQEAQREIFVVPAAALWSGLAVVAVIMGCNLFGDGLRDLFDPKLRELT